MGNVYVKGGTPVGSESLCRTCSSAIIMTGYKESEMITMCTAPDPNIVVPFRIYECSRYYDRNRPTYTQMQKLAIHVDTGPMKPVGFKTGIGFQEAAVVRVGSDDDGDDNYDDD
jgi:hypothetical protein